MTDHITQLRALAGIPDEPVVDEPTPAEILGWLTEQAAERLTSITPTRFHKPIPLHPHITRWVGEFVTDPKAAGSLLLIGATGCGKTHQGYTALRDAILGSYARGVRPTYRVVTYPDFIALTKPAPDNAHVDSLAVYTDADLLFMDDIGADTKSTDWSNTTLFRLVNARWENERPTIWTTNRNQTELTNLLGDRIMSRVWPSRRVLLAGPDHRRSAS